MAATGAPLIVPVNYPDKPEVADPFVADDVSFTDLKHWELAPFNLRLLHEQGIRFAITSAGAGDKFHANLKQAVTNGLPADAAINALTQVPAELLGVQDRTGSLEQGLLANLLVTSGPLFADGTVLLENWVQGERFVLANQFDERRGRYELTAGTRALTLALDVKAGKAEASMIDAVSGDAIDDSNVALNLTDELINLTFSLPGEA
ncbi:MAG: amidohydrolase family protein, partial [Gammaproteobacteria bacterium]|nr:amidohydrolase family protein [Gammaproteobacteria bacterium]